MSRQAEASALRDLGLKYREIADRMGITTGAAGYMVAAHRGTVLRSGPVGRPAIPQHTRRIILDAAERNGVAASAKAWGVAPQTVYFWRRQANA